MTPTSTRTLLAAAVASSLLLVGCSGGGPQQASTPPAGGTSSAPGATAAASADPSAEAAAAEASKAGIDPANPPKPIASSTTAAVVEGDPNATMRVDLLGLKRSGKTVLASYAFTVTAADGASDEPRMLYHYLGNSSWRPQLVDTTNLTLHEVVRADGSAVQTDDQGVTFRPGQTLYAYAVFAAPPESVTTIDAVLADNVPAVPGAPIS